LCLYSCTLNRVANTPVTFMTNAIKIIAFGFGLQKETSAQNYLTSSVPDPDPDEDPDLDF